jgi:hypothetical protein
MLRSRVVAGTAACGGERIIPAVPARPSDGVDQGHLGLYGVSGVLSGAGINGKRALQRRRGGDPDVSRVEGIGCARPALDDFGTGYSSLGYLRHFAFYRLKIDKSFVDGLGQETSSLPLVQAIIAMGRSLGMEVIAERVETALQLKTLRGEGGGQIQGFFLGRPAPRRRPATLFYRPTR